MFNQKKENIYLLPASALELSPKREKTPGRTKLKGETKIKEVSPRVNKQTTNNIYLLTRQNTMKDVKKKERQRERKIDKQIEREREREEM